jgi:hypothetical protein
MIFKLLKVFAPALGFICGEVGIGMMGWEEVEGWAVRVQSFWDLLWFELVLAYLIPRPSK